VPDFQGKPDLSVKFKHLSHAFLVLSFQEGTARAFANDRMVADGEVSHAIRMVRCLDRMEAIILPKMVAKMAVKRYPEHLSLNEKVNKAARIYGLVAKNFLNRS
jgi:predicted alpha/beta-hydrolase family hydrolase